MDNRMKLDVSGCDETILVTTGIGRCGRLTDCVAIFIGKDGARCIDFKSLERWYLKAKKIRKT